MTDATSFQLVNEIDEYRNFHIQGSLIKSRILYVHVNHGASTMKAVLQLLPTDVRELLSKPVYIGEWYPLSLLATLDFAIVQVIGGGSEKVHEDLGTFSADINLTGAYEPLVHRDIHEFLQLTAMLHKSYQDFGEAKYIKMGETAALLQFRYPQPPPKHYCRSGLGYIRRSVEICGGKNVNVRMTFCSRNGDPICEFRIDWQK
ncbi:MAG: hypothetical protein JNN15_03505 [Blastocatellia bacterium]|nr:hypothetical protein [Blastocatellia bacterium]